MFKKLIPLILLLLTACGSDPGNTSDPGSVSNASNPVCLAKNDAFYLSFTETSGTCGPITGVYFSTDEKDAITPGGNSGLECAPSVQDGCSLTGPTCIGGIGMKIESFDLTLTSPTQGSGTMAISQSGCQSSYSLTLTGS